jgi:hypothetical protein
MRRLDGSGIEGPLAPYAAGFARWLLNRGYKRASVDEPLGLLGLLSRWLARESLDALAVSEVVVDRFHTSQAEGRR